MVDAVLKILAIVLSPHCAGLQNLTLAVFGNLLNWVQPCLLILWAAFDEPSKRLIDLCCKTETAKPLPTSEGILLAVRAAYGAGKN